MVYHNLPDPSPPWPLPGLASGIEPQQNVLESQSAGPGWGCWRYCVAGSGNRASHFKVRATGLGGEDGKGRGMRLRVAEMKTGDAWTMKGREGVKRRRETRVSLLIGSLCHCPGPLWVMRMQGQDQLQDPYPCPILILCSSEQSPGYHWDPAVPLCPHKSTVESREGWGPHGDHPSKAHTLQTRGQKQWDEVTHPTLYHE